LGWQCEQEETLKRRLDIFHLCHFHAAPSSHSGVIRDALQMQKMLEKLEMQMQSMLAL